jgi:hypothetical protein
MQQSQQDAARRTPAQQQAAEKQMDALTAKAMSFVRDQKQPSTARSGTEQSATQSASTHVSRQELGGLRIDSKAQHQSKLAAAGRSAAQQQAAERQTGVMTEKAMSFVRNQKTQSATRSGPEQSAHPPQATPAQSQSRIKAFAEQVKGKVNELAEKGKSVIDRVTGQRDNKEKSTGQERNQQKERGKEDGR